jgi:hypothetical protein
VLVDDQQWACEDLDGRRVLPLVWRDGQAWGAPPDDAVAVAELERRQRDGARFVVVPWHAHWWLEHYRALAARLRQGRIVWDDALLTVFELGDHKHA